MSRGRAAQQHRDYREHNALRRLGYRWLPGETYSYLLHLRPREWPIMAGHTALGYLLAFSADADRAVQALPAFLVTLASWVVLLNGGTLALNSAFDRDEGDIGYLDAPPPPPRGLAVFAIVLMVAGQLLALTGASGVAIVYAICFALSLLYSVPPVRLKAVAGADWVINLVGFGALTPLAGWYSSGVPLAAPGLLAMAGFAALFAGFYPLTQIYQVREDRRRGDFTLVLALGVQKSLIVALVFTLIAFVLFFSAWQKGGGSFPGWLLLLPAAAAWFSVIVRWLSRHRGMTDAEHKGGMYQALWAWAVTDVLVVLALLL